MIGIRSLDIADNQNNQNQRGLEDGDLDFCAICITAALQEIFGLGPVDLSEQRLSEVLRPPQPVTFNVTQYSTAISGFATWASWMEGCTVQGIEDDDNELLSATQLLKPVMRGSGAVSGTVYADAVRLPEWVRNTIEPVESPNVFRLESATNRDEFRYWNSPFQGNPSGSRPYPAGGYSYITRTKTNGEPCVYFVEPRYDPSSGSLPLFMRFNPMPGQAYPITFRIKRKPPKVTAADITGLGALTSTGITSPVTAGSYDTFGTFNDLPFYQNESISKILFSDGFNYILQASTGGLAAQVDCWSLIGTSPVGSYTPNGSYTGTPVMTASGDISAGLVTDWQESILLAFAKKRFLSHPVFSNATLAAAVLEEYRIAKQELEGFAAQISPTSGLYR